MSDEYRCTVCGAAFSFEDVRHLARCRECGSGLWRDSASPATPDAARAPVPVGEPGDGTPVRDRRG